MPKGRNQTDDLPVLERFRDRCAAVGLACTQQRQVVYRIMTEPGQHWTPDELFQRARREIPSISLATVYKTIKTFRKVGLLRDLNLPFSKQHLDANLAPHHHLVCLECRRVIDLYHVELNQTAVKAKIPKGFQVNRYCLEILGVCEACADRTRLFPKASR